MRRHAAPAVAARSRRASALAGAALRFEYRLSGELAGLAIPQRVAPRRAEQLWEHTCFEAFVAPAPGAATTS